MSASPARLSHAELQAEVMRLWHREAYFNATQEIAHFGYCEWDYEHDRIKSCTQAYASIFGMTIEEVIESQDSWEKVLLQIHPDDRKLYETSYRENLGAGSHEVEYRAFRKNGEICHIKEVGIVVREADGSISGSVGLLQDITERKEREKDLESRDALTRQVEAITDIGHFIWDIRKDNYAHISPGFARIHGVTVEEYLRRVNSRQDDMADVHEDDRPHLARAHDAERGPRDDYTVEYRIIRHDGKIRWIREQSTIVEDASTDTLQMVGVIQDVTRQKKSEQKLRNARDSLEVAVAERTRELADTIDKLQREMQERERISSQLENQNAELERFAYTVSHDLKAPLVTIKGFAGMLTRDIDEQNHERVQADLENICRAADTMGALLNDLLELSRVGRVIGEPTRFNLGSAVRQAIEALAGDTADNGVEIIIDAMPDVTADEIRIREVFQNLIENAVKFMGEQPAPQIRIGAEETPDLVRCHVSDNGSGIAAEYLEQVFGLFERLHAAVDGTGIGLALVKRIVEVHGGSIWIESEGLQRGSKVIFTLPKSAD
jgi:PAS domain S-box-containing protein